MSLKTQKRSRGIKWFRAILGLFLLFFLACFCYSCATQRTLRREIASTPRDPVTGIATGTEALTLGPSSDASTSGTACLLVHGFLSSRQDFADLGERLAERGVTVRMMRLPGHGTTTVDFAYLPPGALYKAVHAEYQNLRRDFDRVHVVGFSMGGSLSTLLASREPVDRLVLVAPYFGVTYRWYYVLPPAAWNSLFGRFVPFLIRPESFVKVNDKEQVGKFFFYQTLPTAGVRQLMELGKEARRKETLEKVKCPVLVVQSEGDEASAPKATRKAFDNLGSERKELLWLTRSNHVLLWDWDNETVKERIEEFLLGSKPAR